MNKLWAFLARRSHEGPGFYLLCVPVLTAVGVALAWPRLHDLRLRYEYRSLRARQDRLLRENRSLRLLRAKLRALSRVEEIARRDLGMAEPEKGQWVWVKARGLAGTQGDRR